MQTQNIRRRFLQYFKDHHHSVIKSSPVVPYDDPTLLFTNAGMNQFKDVFLGKSACDYTRASTSQKCIRVGGKHNDLENVGHTRRHLTFFEMLGNFSFGDYFKAEAIKFAWEVSTQVFELDPDRIWPTIFLDDDEAFELWTRYVPAERITRFGEKENFWTMGDTGPCGPCSELLFDRGTKYGNARTPSEDKDGERFLEFWNLVFMQYNRSEAGVFEALPRPSIDTGAGLERVVSLQMDVSNVFETDVLRHLIGRVEAISGMTYDVTDPRRAPAFRVIADHLRCLAFAIADGVQPSNVDRGYVLRKVLRRAVRYGRMLGIEDPFLAKVLPSLIDVMGGDYRELELGRARIEEILTGEEEAFIRTLRRGGNLLNQIIDQAQQKEKQISGDDSFRLKDTYGFPMEEILLIAKDSGLTVDVDRYQHLETEAKERSRSVHKTTKQVASENVFAEYVAKWGVCDFIGYEHQMSESKVTGLIVNGEMVDSISAGMEGMVILDRTPFYAEMGGQVGDAGTLSRMMEGRHVDFVVRDCQSPYKGVTVHVGKLERGVICVGDSLIAAIDSVRRQKIANNHTATHILHWALHSVVGEHVKQAGSVVDAERLRFDFSHHKSLTQDEIFQIEDLVNKKIREDLPLKAYELSYEEAQKCADIKQFFGEKYGAVVRVIDLDFSKELCGGTHTHSSGKIGFFRIAKEGSISAGMRRIEAVTGVEAELLARQSDLFLQNLASLLKTQPPLVMERTEKLIIENKELLNEIKSLKKEQLAKSVDSLLALAENVNGKVLLLSELRVSVDELRAYGDAIMEKLNSGVLVLAIAQEERCHVIVRVSDDLVSAGIKAIDLVKMIAPVIEGSGGGKANGAQAGGKAPHKIGEALMKVREFFAG